MLKHVAIPAVTTAAFIFFAQLVQGGALNIHVTVAPPQNLSEQQTHKPAVIVPLNCDSNVAAVEEFDLRLLAATLVGEARYEGDMGMEAVAQTVMNRLHFVGDGARIRDIVLAPRQYSAWNEDSGQRDHLMALVEDATSDPMWTAAYDIAQHVARGCHSPFLPANTFHFYNPDIASPVWADDASHSIRVGNHLFLIGVPISRANVLGMRV